MTDISSPRDLLATIPERTGYFLDDGDMVAVIVDFHGEWIGTAVQEWDPTNSTAGNASRLAKEIQGYPVADATVIPVFYGDHAINAERAAALVHANHAAPGPTRLAPGVFSVQANRTFSMAMSDDLSRWTPPQELPPATGTAENPLGPQLSRRDVSKQYEVADQAELILRGVTPTPLSKAKSAELHAHGPRHALRVASAALTEISRGENLDRAPGQLAAAVTDVDVRDVVLAEASSSSTKAAAAIDAFRLSPDAPGRQDLACIAATANYIDRGSLHASLSMLNGAPHEPHRLTELLSQELRNTPAPEELASLVTDSASRALDRIQDTEEQLQAKAQRSASFPQEPGKTTHPTHPTSPKPHGQESGRGKHVDGLER